MPPGARSVPAVILAAGMGVRLGYDTPKCLVRFGPTTILHHQLDNFRSAGIEEIIIVVGFQAEKVRAHPVPKGLRVTYVENREYMDTQTSKSLLAALEAVGDRGFLQVNGDVVFDPAILLHLLKEPAASKLAAREGAVGEEEIKYVLTAGRVVELSKKVMGGHGEAVGLNYFAASDVPLLRKALAYVAPGAYFERAIEHMLPYTERPLQCVPIGKHRAMEIDFPEDLDAALRLFGHRAR